MILGAGVTAIGSGLIYTFDIDSPSRIWIGYQVRTLLFQFGLPC